MNKTFLVLLISAIAVWGYAVTRFFWNGSHTNSRHQASFSDGLPNTYLLAWSRPPLDTSFRDPFQSYLYAQKPVAPKAKSSLIPKPTNLPAVIVEPPKATLNGILWGDPPMAILKFGDKTEVVKAGVTIGDFQVLRIERNQVVVKKQGREFILGY